MVSREKVRRTWGGWGLHTGFSGATEHGTLAEREHNPRGLGISMEEGVMTTSLLSPRIPHLPAISFLLPERIHSSKSTSCLTSGPDITVAPSHHFTVDTEVPL